jgi:hypothetical protein
MDAADELAKHVALPLGDVCMSRLSSPRLVSSSNIRYWPGAVVPYLSGSLLFFLLYTRGKLQFINNNSIYIFDFFFCRIGEQERALGRVPGIITLSLIRCRRISLQWQIDLAEETASDTGSIQQWYMR